ncbi:MAG: HAD family hydrolase [Sphingomonas sp.]
MIAHFGAWLDEAHAIDFKPVEGHFAEAMTRQADASLVPAHEVWPLLDGFFATEMHRQTLVPHAREALAEIAKAADILILTNLGDHCHPGRVAQLDALGIRHQVRCNQGGKGGPVAQEIAARRPSACVFVDDLAVHHASVAEHAPSVWRLHMVAEPSIAGAVPPAPAAHARIDDWAEALPWVLEKLRGGPAPEA